MKKTGLDIAILLCFIASLMTFSYTSEIIKALITGGLIGLWIWSDYMGKDSYEKKLDRGLLFFVWDYFNKRI